MGYGSSGFSIVRVTLAAALATAIAMSSGCSKPAWEHPNPPLWAFVTSNNASDGHFRFFINTKAIRNNAGQRTVRVLMRTQRITPGEEESQDVPKVDEQTTVQNFTCDPNKKGYDISATLRMHG